MEFIRLLNRIFHSNLSFERKVIRAYFVGLIFIGFLVLATLLGALPVMSAFDRVRDQEITLELAVRMTPYFLASFAVYFISFSILGPLILRRLDRFVLRPSRNWSSEESISESVSATERLVATTGDVLVRDFKLRIENEIQDAVERLSNSSDALIKEKIAERIDEKVGDDIVSILGSKLAEQTEQAHQLNILRQESFDRFVQMRNRALQYAEAARKQAANFRRIGIALALGGLGVLGYVFFANHQQFANDQTLLEKKVNWTILFIKHGPSYAFVALCEFLALIMFRYQSKALEYMRYFSNESTNIDARHIAFASGLKLLDKTRLSKLIERLEATERNFLIGKDQRTLELANNENEDRLLEKVRKLTSITRGHDFEIESSSSKTSRKKVT